jgi:archaellum component FlaC
MDEEIRAGFADMRRGFAEVNARLDRVDGRLDRMDGRLDQMDGRLDRMDGWLDRMDGWLDRMDGRLDRMDGRLDRMDGRLDEANRGTAVVGQRVDSLEERLVREIRQLGVMTEDLRGQVQLVAEGVIVNGRAIEQLRGEMNERFRENEIIVGGAFRQIRRDLDELRGPRQ